MNEQLQTLEFAQRTAIELAIQFGPKVLVALLIMGLGFYVGRVAARLVDSMLVKLGLEATLRQVLGRTAHLLVIGLFVILALQNLGVQLLPLLAGLGVVGAGVALAMQGVLGNLAAGLTIIFTRPFLVGEYISIANEEGTVDEIRLFNTVLSHTDRSRIVIPNRKIAGEILHNYGVLRQLNVVVGVAYDSNIAQALELVHQILAADALVLKEPAPDVSVLTLAESNVRIAVRPWARVPDFNRASSSVTQSVLEGFRAHGIHMPVPQRDIRMLAAG